MFEFFILPSTCSFGDLICPTHQLESMEILHNFKLYRVSTEQRSLYIRYCTCKGSLKEELPLCGVKHGISSFCHQIIAGLGIDSHTRLSSIYFF